MAKTPQEFYNKYNGKRIDADGVYGCQCVDGFKAFCQWAGLPVYTTGTGYADGYWYNRNTSGYSRYFTFVTGASNFKNGDWVIWARGSVYKNSHIAMYYNGMMFGENQGGDRGFRLISAKWSGALGAFRWKGWQTETTTKTTAKATTSSTSVLSSGQKVDSEPTTVKTTDKKETEKAQEEKKEPEEEKKETEKVQKRVTIAEVNGGKDYIANAAGVSLFGRISRVVKWDDVTKPQTLYDKAKAMVENASTMAFSLEVDAVDSRLLNFNVGRLRMGDVVEVISPPHGIDMMIRLSKWSIPLDNPAEAKYTMGATVTAMTEQQVAQRRESYKLSEKVVTVTTVDPDENTEYQDLVNRSSDWIEMEVVNG